jgi:hypothetical protein
MRKEKTKESTEKNLAIPGKAISKKELKELILDAESGTFHEVAESKALFVAWRKKNYRL